MSAARIAANLRGTLAFPGPSVISGISRIRGDILAQIFPQQRLAGSNINDAARRLPTISPSTVMARDGFLMSYGFDNMAIWRRAASHMDRIFKGANPAKLPVEQTDRFEFTINPKTAHAIGFDLPPALLARADEV